MTGHRKDLTRQDMCPSPRLESFTKVYRDATDTLCQSLAKTTIADVLRGTVARYGAALPWGAA